MSKIVCKNGCSGKKGFGIDGLRWCSASVDGNGYIEVDCSPYFDVRNIECYECGDEWDVKEGEIVV